MDTKQISLFVNLALAIIKGDAAEEKAIKIQKKAIASLTAQIAAKTYHTLSLEDAIENAEADLSAARVNGGELITDNTGFIKSLLKSGAAIKEAKEALGKHLDEIAFLEAELAIAKS